MNYIERKKLNMAIAFFAKNHSERVGRPLYQTYLYKYLAFVDQQVLKATGHPAFNIDYKALPQGPVPPFLYENPENQRTEEYEFREDYDSTHGGKMVVTYLKKIDFDYFSKKESQILQQVLNRLSHDFMSTSEISEKSHEEIISWQKAYKNKTGSIMNWADELELDTVSDDQLSLVQESFLYREALRENISR